MRDFPRGVRRDDVVSRFGSNMKRQYVAIYDNACNEIGKLEEGATVGERVKVGAAITSQLPYTVVIDKIDSKGERAKISFSYADVSVDSEGGVASCSTANIPGSDPIGETMTKKVWCAFDCSAAPS